jgi:hypothetical protein
VAGRPRPEDVVVDRAPPRSGARLTPAFSAEADTGAATQDDLLAAAFPHLARAYESGPTRAALADALRRDVAAHHAETVGRGVTLDDTVDAYRMLRTARWYFAWRDGERFARLPAPRFVDFIHGQVGIRTGGAANVNIVAVEVEIDRRRPVRGRLLNALRLGVGPRGRIVAAHRADAGDARDGEDSVAAFITRRNEAVQWKMSAEHRRALADACEDIAPGFQLEFA